MIYVGLAIIACGWVVSTSALLAMLRSQMRAHARDRDLLLNQLLHAVGKPWTTAPAAERAPVPAPEPRTYTASPEQLPIDD